MNQDNGEWTTIKPGSYGILKKLVRIEEVRLGKDGQVNLLVQDIAKIPMGVHGQWVMAKEGEPYVVSGTSVTEEPAILV